jgi:o-succinylbenzoate synthase
MALAGKYFKKVFQFNFKARTSRGLMKDRTAWFVKVWDDKDPLTFGIGECGPLAGLSQDANADVDGAISKTLEKISEWNDPDLVRLKQIIPDNLPAVLFAFETAFLDLANGGRRICFENDFTGTKIPINGLIWMGDMDFLMSQINQKIAQGFKCIKIKVGGLDFDRECDTLNYVRKRYFRDDITIRLDANGAFKIDDVLYRLEELSRFDIHSIEQPIKPGLPEMEELCRKSPIPVAFDEELIGKNSIEEKRILLSKLRPQYIILKPTLHGGFQGCREWIEIAESLHIGWWITSALESNIGLNAICQFTAQFDVKIPQGLGTGAIYLNNFPSPLTVEQGHIYWDMNKQWDMNEIVNL